MSIRYSNQDIDFSLQEPLRLNKWIGEVIARHGKQLGSINYRFCSDEHILEVNQQFLNHDTYTDIITFDCVRGNLISGDVLISLDRVGENAVSMGTSFEDELHRVLIHGVLHLLGFKDKSDSEAAEMRRKEEESLVLLATMN